MIKLIFSDIDGTLLDSKGRMPPDFDEVIAQLAARGVLFAPCSGRQYFSLLDSFPAYRDKFLFVAENGALVMYQGRELFASVMERALIRQVVLAVAARFPEACCLLCGKRAAYIRQEQAGDAVRAALKKYGTHFVTAADFSAIGDEPVKLSFFDASGRAESTVYQALQPFADRLHVICSDAHWVDVMNRESNKGAAIRQVQQKLGVQPDECAAFGDARNDREMMEAVGCSFAMANAHPKIQALARFAAAGNDEGGVLRAIRRLIAEGLCG